MSQPPLYEQLYASIADAIAQGKLRPGDRVPSEMELATQYEVSRITSKAALEKLYREGLIERKRGKGSFVAQHAIDATVAAMRPTEEQRPAMFGVVLPDFSEVFGLNLLHSIEARAAERGAYLLIKRTYGSQSEEEKAIRALMQLGVTGLIVFPVHGDYYNQELLRVVLAGFPVVLVDRYLKGIPASTVSTDNLQAGKALTDYLLRRGHRHIAFLSPPAENTSSIEDRIRGYRDALAAHGVALKQQYVLSDLKSPLPVSFDADHVSDDLIALRGFFQRHPEITAVVASEYNVALLAQQATQQTQLTCEITCFDSPYLLFSRPAFTHIRQNETVMGITVVDALLAHINRRSAPVNHVIDFELVETETAVAV
jgi:DNA-binding LacI/PurR family transcriptional regulator